MTVHAARTTRSSHSTGWVPFALVALVVIPAIAGSLRLVEVFGGPHVLLANPRLVAPPVPLVVHIVSTLTYAVLGAFQFSAALRRAGPAGIGPPVGSWSCWDSRSRPRRCG